jgi:predicted ATPase/class 3 adenylate cyclase/Tfp pilus assembly protein PilF
MEGVAQPSGTVTLVFTDIEGSTRLLRELGPNEYRSAIGVHRRVVREAFQKHNGYEVDYEGDAFFYAFPSATGAVQAVSEAMAGLEGGPIVIRVGAHTGEPILDPPKYIGLDVHTAARIMASGHGGQVVVSRSTRELLDGSFELSDLGEHRLKDLSGPQRLYQLGSGTFPPLKTLHRTNLPVPATAFVGRDQELSELAGLIEDGVQLLVLTGPGGVGKTRLALQSAAEVADGFPDGVWWVPLASVRDPGLVMSSVARALGVPEQAGRSVDDTVVDVLSSGRALVLLDNLEHLLPHAATAIACLRDAGGATVVVTSRERLQLSGERVYPVDPLDPNSATALFAARATALGVGVGEPEPVIQLCTRLDNLPLAIELAAARATLLSPAEILSRLGDRLDGLRGGRDSDPRQQTLRATIGWSHDLLDQPERELFARLAVFSGGATLDAIEVVCGSGLDVLGSLLDKSLVRRTGERVWMLETIREFAVEQLAAYTGVDELRDRHATYYVTFAEDAGRRLRGADHAGALQQFAAELDNLRAVFERLGDTDPASAVRLAAALWTFWFQAGHLKEGREKLQATLHRAAPEPTEARASALVGAGLLALEWGDNEEAISRLEEGLSCARAAGSTRTEAIAVSLLAARPDLDRDEHHRLGEEAIAIARASGDRWVLGLVTGNHGALLLDLGETGQADDLLEEAYRLSRGVGDASLTALWLANLASSALRRGDTVDARTRLDEALELARRIDDTRGVGIATVSLGSVELLEEDLDHASSRFEEGASIARRLGSRAVGAEALSGLAQVAAARGDRDRAARLAGAAATLSGSPAGYDPTNWLTTLSPYLLEGRAALGEHAWEKCWDEGAALDFEAAMNLALDR